MSAVTHDKKAIAVAQLETALTLFEQGQDLFSVITLAGAAEEILGQLVGRTGQPSSLAAQATATAAIRRLPFKESVSPRAFKVMANRARNTLKHLDDDEATTVTFDVTAEAIDIINRAIDNYWLLEQSLSPRMEGFARQHGPDIENAHTDEG